MSAQPQSPGARSDTLVFSAFELDEVILDLGQRQAYSSDVYSRGITAAAVLRPRDKDRCAAMVAAAARAGFAVIGRGGGLSYTGG